VQPRGCGRPTSGGSATTTHDSDFQCGRHGRSCGDCAVCTRGCAVAMKHDEDCDETGRRTASATLDCGRIIRHPTSIPTTYGESRDNLFGVLRYADRGCAHLHEWNAMYAMSVSGRGSVHVRRANCWWAWLIHSNHPYYESGRVRATHVADAFPR